MDKPILDACCGARMFWFDKENPRVVFQDCRTVDDTLCDGRRLEVKPDVVGDFRYMIFPDDSFRLVVFDPPHLRRVGKTSWLAKKYGVLTDDWKDDLRKGFAECMRVLESRGVLIFKWNEEQISITDVLKLFPQQPLFGNRRGKTVWLVWMKD
nr:MAG TPA: hypothetical protein [Caudoviricetes sp.]